MDTHTHAEIFVECDEWKSAVLSARHSDEIGWTCERYPNDEVNLVLQVEEGQRWEKITLWVRFSTKDRLEMQVFRLLLIAETAARYCDHLELKMPYFPYSLQDREVHTGDAVAARVLTRALEGVGVQSVTIIDAHSPANIQGWSIPITHLHPERLLADAIQAHLQESNVAVVSPDKGAVMRANLFGEYLHAPVFQLEKQRLGPGKVEVQASSLNGCPAKQLVIVDDILNTGGTLVQSIRAIRETCSAKMSIAVTHGFFVSLAHQRLLDSGAQYIFYTDTFVSGIDESQLGVVKVSILPLLLEK